jgi:pimeloyl-ACP methyl ester carboxylesterase
LPLENGVLRFVAAALAVVLCGVTVPVTTTPQPDNSGVLADRQFLVRTTAGSGYARYFGTSSLDGDASVTRAVIIVHGVLRDADYYYDTGVIAANAARVLSDTLVIAPQFVEKSDLAGHSVSAQTLYWSGQWPGGSDAIAPAPISTYEVFDAMIARLSDARRFPKLREIVVVGHSAGGQIVQRYAVVAKAPQLDSGPVPVRLIVSNPSSYFYFTDWRPYPARSCSDFNEWRYGLRGAPRYVSGSASDLEARYVKRQVVYLMGTADVNPNEDDLDRSCGGEAQGPYRFSRAKYYIEYLARRHPGGTAQRYAFVEGVPHDNRRMFTSACGLAVIFGGNTTSCAAAGRVGVDPDELQ